MSEEWLCPHCSAWMLRADDAWCGYCGASCARLQLTLTPSVLHIGHRPPRLVSLLSNLSCAELPVRTLEAPTWLAFPTPDPKLSPGQPYTALAEADYTKITTPQSGTVRVTTPAGQAEAEVIWIEERPKLVCVPDKIEVWSGCDAAINLARVDLRPAAGKLRIRSVTAAKLRGRVEAGTSHHGPLASADAGVPLTLQLDARGFENGTFKTPLTVEYDSPHGPSTVEVPLSVVVRHPPQLFWEVEHQRPVVLHQAERQRLQFTLHNQAPDGRSGGTENATLIVTSFELSPPSQRDIPSRLIASLPQPILGGHAWTAHCEVDLQHLRGQPAQQIEFQLTVRTNYPVLHSPVPVIVEPLRRFDGVVAIDFGSSNSCCAVMQPGGDLELVPLDEASVISPTLLSYIDLEVDPPVVETGSRMKRAVDDGERAASIADRLKQKLGEDRHTLSIRPKKTLKWLPRDASQAATDYLRTIRQTIEREKNATFDDFVLTHPARCSLRQYQRLRKALLDAFGSADAQISFLQEPVAALIPFMADRARQSGAAPYTAASFDLGGGTTDIALVKVQHVSTSSGQVQVHPSIVYCRGLNFGGEDLSDFLVGEIERRCRQFLSVKEPGATLIAEGVPGAAALDIRRNRAALMEAAEQFKASLSEQRSVAAPEQIALRVTLQGGLTTGIDVDFRPIRSSVGVDLERQFLEYARTEVECAARLLVEAVESTGMHLDVIQLSGMTTFLAVVQETLTRLFPGVLIVRTPDPKECVVKGACLSRTMLHGAVVLRLPEVTQRMTSSIGVFSPNDAAFLPLLRVDEVIPPGGLQHELPDIWNGRESIVLWEDLNDLHGPVDYSTAARQLSRLGTWKPGRTVTMAADQRWPLRLALKDLRLEVHAIDPAGAAIPFHPPFQQGD